MVKTESISTLRTARLQDDMSPFTFCFFQLSVVSCRGSECKRPLGKYDTVRILYYECVHMENRKRQ
eukprot:scaffold5827_cov97-Cylindrotheca_fusiformis.AAC.2